MKKSILVGDLYENNKGESFKVVEYNNWEDILIEFCDRYHGRKTVSSSNIFAGRVKNPYKPSVYGVGVSCGVTDVKSRRDYKLWVSMISRCYNESYKRRKPTYYGCTVADEWLIFDNFSEWVIEQIGFDLDHQLDKDILGDGKLYSPDNCCLVPAKINMVVRDILETSGAKWVQSRKKYVSRFDGVFLGYFDDLVEAKRVYDSARSSYIHKLAEHYKNQINQMVYTKLLEFGERLVN